MVKITSNSFLFDINMYYFMCLCFIPPNMFVTPILCCPQRMENFRTKHTRTGYYIVNHLFQCLQYKTEIQQDLRKIDKFMANLMRDMASGDNL